MSAVTFSAFFVTVSYVDHFSFNSSSTSDKLLISRLELLTLMPSLPNTFSISFMFSVVSPSSSNPIEEKTPAFTTLQNASVPIKPAGPKRAIFVLGMCFIAMIITAFWLVRKSLFETPKAKNI